MKPNFRTCPQCSTRNRLDKEYCVKCGEPLEGITAGDATLVMGPASTSTKKGKPGFFVGKKGEEAQSLLVPIVVVILILGVAFAGWLNIRDIDAAATAAEPQAAPQRQVSIPAAVVAPMEPGVKEYTSGMAALRGGDLTGAVRLLRLAVAAANRADYRLGLAEALEKSGLTSQALVEYEAAAGLGIGNVRYTSEWAKALNRAGRNTEAIRAYEASLQVDSQNLANLRELVSLHLKANDFVKARPHLERIVQLQPDDLAPKQNLARALEASRDFPGAAKQYRDILINMPQADLTRALLSENLMKQNRPDEALQLLEEGLRLDASSGLLYREKGRILDRQGRSAEAVVAYREYIRLSPGATDIRVFTTRISQLSPPAQP